MHEITESCLVCRCRPEPRRAMRSAARLFDHSDACRARDQHVAPVVPPGWQRRALLDTQPLGSSVNNSGAPAQHAPEGHPPDPAGAAQQHNLQRRLDLPLQLPELPKSQVRKEQWVLRQSQKIQRVQHANMLVSRWLGDFRPMRMACPLLGRKVAPELMPEFAAVAWSCEGLGFAWECLLL
jgi:hypothetical protein